MEIFNIGILEIVLILVIAVIVLGPDGMVKSAQSMGRFLRKIIKSPIWAQLMDTQRELRDMPTRLVREAGLEEDLKELKKTSMEVKRTSQELRSLDITGGTGVRSTTPPATPAAAQSPAESEVPPAPQETGEHTIAPPEAKLLTEKTETNPDPEI